MVCNTTSKSSSSRPSFTKNFTSKPPSNNTSRTGAGHRERRQQQPTRGKPGACWSCGVTGHKRADGRYQLKDTNATSAARLTTRLQCAHVAVKRHEKAVLRSSVMEMIVVCKLLLLTTIVTVLRYTVHVPAEQA